MAVYQEVIALDQGNILTIKRTGQVGVFGASVSLNYAISCS